MKNKWTRPRLFKYWIVLFFIHQINHYPVDEQKENLYCTVYWTEINNPVYSHNIIIQLPNNRSQDSRTVVGLRSYIQVRLTITRREITELKNHEACMPNIKRNNRRIV